MWRSKWGVIPTNPCIGVERPRTQDSDPTSRTLSLDEIDRLIDVLPSAGPYQRFVIAMLCTGCRVVEIAALRVADYANTRNDAAKRGAAAFSELYSRQSEGQLEG